MVSRNCKDTAANKQRFKVFGIGWAKTGTTTLGRCFEILGFDHQSQRLDLVNDIARGDFTRIMALAAKKQAFEDWPWILLYRELDRAFPGSRFILTGRDPGRWLGSYQNMLRSQGKASEEMNEIRRILYGLPFPHVTEQDLIARFQRHNNEVLAYFRNRPECLLCADWEKGHGWKELCGFLRCPIPAEPFPHANRGDYRRPTHHGSPPAHTRSG
jgi:hypothetical protein